MKRLLGLLLLIPLSLAHAEGNFENAIIKVAAESGKSVVSISNMGREKIGVKLGERQRFRRFNDDSFGKFFEDFFGNQPEVEFKRIGLGSGIIIDKEGYILTNEHVIAGATEIKVKLSDGREFDAQVIGSDKRSDLAVIKINAANLSSASWGIPTALKQASGLLRWVILLVLP
ncbi:MAG: trypsin-like peptidase domain-containing protein [Candidatus Omnitrophica bacterium]|nr:trypsin-like peptidase domain-containing protein [Candidatus Omnitrophota bacterium]